MDSLKPFDELDVYDSAAREVPIISQLKGVYARRSLLRLLVARDLTVRYKRSVLGIWWTLLNPLLTTTVFFFVFNTVFKAKMATGTLFLPYLLSGTLCMTFFSQAMTMAADAISQSASVLTKVYVRPEIFAFSTTIAGAVNFLFGMAPLTAVLLFYGKLPGYKAPLVLIFVLCMTLFTTGLGLLLAIAYVNFDDSRSIIGIFLMLLQYMTPVFYPITALGPHTQRVIKLNPLTSYMQVLRSVWGNNGTATTGDWIYMILSAVVIFIIGMFYFQKKWPGLVAKL